MENQGLQVLECECGWQCHEADKPFSCLQCESRTLYPLWNVFNRYGCRMGVVAGFTRDEALSSAQDAFDAIPGLTVRAKHIMTS